MGPLTLSDEKMLGWFTSAPRPQPYSASVPPINLVRLFLQEGFGEGVTGDIAFCQAIIETNWFTFTGIVPASANNFGGLGATGAPGTYNTFPDARTGVRAHVQHLRRYADPSAVDPSVLHHPIADPRFGLVNPPGKAPRWNDLGHGNWAASTRENPTYGESILMLFAQAVAWGTSHSTRPPT